MATPSFVLATTAGQASATDLAYFADAATAVLPTTPSTALDASFKSIGELTPDGVTMPTALTQTDIPVFGSTSPVRTLITQEILTATLTALETNKITEALLTRQPLSGITVTSAVMSTTRGPGRDAVYSLVVDGIDGGTNSAFRRVFPRIRMTGPGDENIGFNSPLQTAFTFTAYLDNSGVSCYRYTKVTGLT